MLAENLTIGAQVEKCVVENGVAGFGILLVDADRNSDSTIGGGLTEAIGFRAGKRDRIAMEFGERGAQRMGVTGRDEPDPERVTGDEGFREYSEGRASSCCFLDQRSGLVDRG